MDVFLGASEWQIASQFNTKSIIASYDSPCGCVVDLDVDLIICFSFQNYQKCIGFFMDDLNCGQVFYIESENVFYIPEDINCMASIVYLMTK